MFASIWLRGACPPHRALHRGSAVPLILRHSLPGRVLRFAAAPLALAAAVALLAAHYLDSHALGFAAGLLAGLPLLILALQRALSPTLSLLRALSGAVHNIRDGDFSTSLTLPAEVELAELVAAHNALGDLLREERQHLGQRELLLDTVVQNTPVALVLTESKGRIVYANLAARRLFDGGRRLEGQGFDALLQQSPPPLREAVADGQDRLCTVELEGQDEVFHVSRRGFRLNGRPHALHLFRRLTQELARQEVQTWKKLIRVISHELNNSLAPISSLAHSGGEWLRRGDTARLAQVFATIEERARHLDGFIRGYAQFAKLPTPRLEAVEWAAFIERLQSQTAFRIEGELPAGQGRFDPAQLGQALINLLKNAAESGSPPEQVTLTVQPLAAGGWRIEVADRGSGMSEAVLANALVPFYSTKRSGTGLGLALAREIVEAHGGRIALANRAGGGLAVSLQLPG
jgi:two-component system, NtrC family, nitrogen regulation sensor histidine kinase NtrY